MQSLNARAQYRSSFHCAYRIFTEDGVMRFWTGTTPRLVRLVIAGGVTFSVYEVYRGVLSISCECSITDSPTRLKRVIKLIGGDEKV